MSLKAKSRKGLASTKQAPCKKCENEVTDGDQGIQCELCERWHHLKCTDVDVSVYLAINKANSGGSQFHWFCEECNISVGEMMKGFKELKSKNEILEKGLKDLKDEVGLLSLKVNENSVALETAIEAKLIEAVEKKVEITLAERVKSISKDVVSNLDMTEKLDIERRKNNIIVHGVTEDGDTSDIEKIESIFRHGLRILPDRHVEDVQRVGHGTNDKSKIRPIRIKLKSMESKYEILRHAKELKDSTEYKKIYVSLDLTRKQQVIDKELRQQLKHIREEGEKDAKIKAGKVIKNLPDGQVRVLYCPKN